LALATLLLPVATSGQETAQQPAPLKWQAGPITAPIGDGLAEIDVGEGYVFLDAAETQRLLELNQNPVDGSELATVAPLSEEMSWFVIFEWSEMGWVSDEDQDELDADSILESIRQGTEARCGLDPRIDSAGHRGVERGAPRTWLADDVDPRLGGRAALRHEHQESQLGNHR
jgi:uncharacterized membrane-anchored protein